MHAENPASRDQFRFGLSEILLSFSALFWGATFVVVKQATREVDPALFIGGRFLLAALMLVLFFPKTIWHYGRQSLKDGVILGLLLTAGFLTQTFGLRYTTASASGFITGLSIILVAVISIFVNRAMPRPLAVGGIVSGTAGLLLLGLQQGRLVFSRGDLLTLACAFAFAAHITMTGQYAPRSQPLALSAIQFATVAAITLGASLVGGTFSTGALASVWPALVFTGIFASGLAFLFQTIAQRRVNPVKTAIILAAEPLFAGLFAFLVLHENFGWLLWSAGALIVLGMVLTSVDTGEPDRNTPGNTKGN